MLSTMAVAIMVAFVPNIRQTMESSFLPEYLSTNLLNDKVP